MIKVGITGQVGTGKSTATGLFAKYGAKIIDSDAIAHSLIKPKSECWGKIVEIFGRDILKKNNEINRKTLGRIVFGSAGKRKTLNNILHPEVVKEIKKQLKQTDMKAIVVIEIPLLIEAGLFNLADKIIVVKCSREQQLKRLAKIGIKKNEAEKMIKSQFSLKRKLKYADYVIDNSGTKLNTNQQIKKILKSVIAGSKFPHL